MNELSGANVGRLLDLPFLKAGFKVCLFARVGDNLPCLRFHDLCCACWGRRSLISHRAGHQRRSGSRLAQESAGVLILKRVNADISLLGSSASLWCNLIRVSANFFPCTLLSQSLFHSASLARLQVIGVTFHLFDDVLLLYLPLKPAQRIFERFAFLNTNLCQKIPPPNMPMGFSMILERENLIYRGC